MKISSCENEFIIQCIVKGKRLDGRRLSVGRSLELAFGQERGCCMVMLGNTRTLAQVSCEVTEPKPSRLTEGILHVNLELSSMARPDIKLGRMSEESVSSQTLLERCIRDSKCIDLESLCIIAGSKVWSVRVDVHTLNDDGNLVECASIAAISALAHFRRPDITVVGTDVTVHSVDDREPVALNLHHMPININLALYGEGKYIVVDPLEIEEKIADGCFIVGVNSHQEICVQHFRGALMLKVNIVLLCLNVAIKRVQSVTQVIRQALDDDAYKRKTNAPIGFVSMIKTGTVLGAKRLIPEIDLKEIAREAIVSNEVIDVVEAEDTPPSGDQNTTLRFQPSEVKEKALKILKEAETAIFEGGKSKWAVESEDDNDDSEPDDETQNSQKQSTSLKEESHSELRDDDSEEETVYMDSDQVDIKGSTSRGWYTKNPFK